MIQQGLLFQAVADYIVDQCILTQDSADQTYRRLLKERFYEKLKSMWFRPFKMFIGRSEVMYRPGTVGLEAMPDVREYFRISIPGVNEAELARSANRIFKQFDFNTDYSLN